MTVCLAAICASSAGQENPIPAIVGASDRMVSNRIMGAEPAISKIVPFTRHIVALMAGDPRLHATIVNQTWSFIAASSSQTITVRTVAETYATQFASARLRKAERTYLTPLGLFSLSFLNRQQNLPPEVVANLTGQLQGYELEAEALVIGLDNTGAHIYLISDPGNADACDFDGYAAIGIGGLHAESEYMAAGYTNQWPFAKALFLAYSAKRRAQAAPEVGQYTDLFFIGGDGFRLVDENHLATIRRVHQRAHRKQTKAWEQAQDAVEEYIEAIQKEAEVARTWKDDAQTDIPNGE